MAAYESLAPASTDSRDNMLVIREVTPGIVTFSVPFVSSRRHVAMLHSEQASI